jgi:hypothetical protein
MILSQSNHYDSSILKTSSYDYRNQDMFMTFKSGHTYLYKGVSLEIYEEFVNSELHGAALNRLNKNNKDIECIKITVNDNIPA